MRQRNLDDLAKVIRGLSWGDLQSFCTELAAAANQSIEDGVEVDAGTFGYYLTDWAAEDGES